MISESANFFSLKCAFYGETCTLCLSGGLSVGISFMDSDVFFQKRLLGSGESPCEETVADVCDGLGGRMAHVLGVEAVVAQLVQHYLISRKIVRDIIWIHAQIHRTSLQEGLYAEQKGGFAELVSVSPVLEMADRAYCEDELLGDAALNSLSVRRQLIAEDDDFLKCLCDLIDGKSLPNEFCRRSFETVRNNLPRSQIPEAPARSEGYDYLV